MIGGIDQEDSKIWDRLIRLKLSSAKELRLEYPTKEQMSKLKKIAKQLKHLKKVEILVWDEIDVIEQLCLALIEMPNINHFRFRLNSIGESTVRKVLDIIDSHPKLKSIVRVMDSWDTLPSSHMESILKTEYRLERWHIVIGSWTNEYDQAFYSALKSKSCQLFHLRHLKLVIKGQFNSLLDWIAVQRQLR